MAAQQDRVELKGSARAALPGAKDVGPADPNQQIEVSVLVRRGSAPDEFASLEQMCLRLPHQRKYLSREDFARLHGAAAADFEKIRAFASQFGLKVVSEDRATRTLKLSGTVKAFNEAFGVDLRHYQHGSGAYRCRSGNLTIPSNLDGVVEGVFGLDNRPQAKTHFRLRKEKSRSSCTGNRCFLLARSGCKGLRFSCWRDGAGQCIAVIELGGGYNAADLDSFFRNLGISTPKVTAVSVDGGANSPTGDSSGPDGEVELDIEVAGAIASAAQIAAYFAPNTDQGFIDAITTAVHDAKLKPSIISISWGGPEGSWTEQSRNALNSACQEVR